MTTATNPPTSPGVYDDLDFATYAAIDAINWSKLKRIGKSPAHYRWALTAGDNDTSSRGMLRAVHCLVLEPHVFDRDFATFTGKTRRGKVYDAWAEENTGKTHLNQRETDEANAIAEAVHANPYASALLNHPGARTEVTIVWRDEATGLLCKARIDLLVIDGDRATVCDLKTVKALATIGKDAARMGYHSQIAGHYRAAVAAAFPELTDIRCVLLCVEGADEHDVGLFPLNEAAEYAGKAWRDDLMARLADCRKRDEWPGQCPKPEPLVLPSWAPGMDIDTPENL